MGRRGKRLLALLFLCNALQLLIGEASGSEDRFRAGGSGSTSSRVGAPRGGTERRNPPPPLVQRRSFDTRTSDSWAFFNIGSSRNKRKLPSGRETSADFSCRDRPPGYYADMNLGCEVYHLCNRHGGGMAFECPRGTRFQQRTMVCDHEHLVECHQSAKYFHSNLRIGQANVNFIDDKQRSSSFQPFSNNGDDVFMQVVVRNTASTTTSTPPTKANIQKSNNFLNKEIRENQRMQLVFKQQQKKLKKLKKQQQQQQQLLQQQKLHNLENNHNSFSSPEAPKKSLTLKGRGKDTFFLLAQDTDAPGAIRDSRKVPKKVLNQLKKVQSAKLPNKDPRDLPTFPNYPVNMEHDGKEAKIGEDRKLTFHQAYGTDFDNLRPRLSTKTVRKSTKPVTRTTKAPTFILTPPEVNAPVAEFYRTKKRKKKKKGGKKKKKKPIHRLPKNHPLRSVLPPTARVVGIQPLRKLALSNRGENAEIMTLGDFLRKFPTMEKMKSTSIVPVPVTEAKHLRMIELLSNSASRGNSHSNNQKPGQKQSLEQALDKKHPNPFPPFTFEDNKADLDEMFKELEQLISKRAERKISFVNSQHHGLLHHDHRVKEQKQKQKQKSKVAPADTKKVSSSITLSTQPPSGGPGLAVRPRGGLPGPRFMVTTKSTTQITAGQTTKTTDTNQVQTVFSSTLNSWDNPKLEFGFVPITQTTSVAAVATAATTVTPGGSISSFASLTSTSGDSSSNFRFRNPSSSGSSRFRFSSFDDIIDETDQLVAPRLPRQPDNNINSIETNEINLDHPNPNLGGSHDAFFFTTTPKPSKAAVGVSVSPSSSLLAEQQNNNKFIKPGIFDMRKFFFIPTKNHHLSKSQAERRVHHNHHNRPGFGPHERGSHPLPPPLLTPQHIQPHRGFKFRG